MTRPPRSTALPRDTARTATGPSSDALAWVLSRLPEHLIARDAEAGGRSRADRRGGRRAGPAGAGPRALYDGWFVETSAASARFPTSPTWSGSTEVPPDLGLGVSRRALVANTIAYRRRKGTVTVLAAAGHRRCDRLARPGRRVPPALVADPPRPRSASTGPPRGVRDTARWSSRDPAARRRHLGARARCVTRPKSAGSVAAGRYGWPPSGRSWTVAGRRPATWDGRGPRGRRTVGALRPAGPRRPAVRRAACRRGDRASPPSPTCRCRCARGACWRCCRRRGGNRRRIPVDPPLPLGGPGEPAGARPGSRNRARSGSAGRPELVPRALRVAGLEGLDGRDAEPTQVLVDPTTGRLTVYSGGVPDVAGERGVTVRYAGGNSPTSAWEPMTGPCCTSR